MPRSPRFNLLAASVALLAATGPAFAAGIHGGGGSGHVSGGGGAQPAAGQNFGASSVGRGAPTMPGYYSAPTYYSPNNGVMRPVGPGANQPVAPPAFPARNGPAYRAYRSSNNPVVIGNVNRGTAYGRFVPGYGPGGYFLPYTFATFNGFNGVVAGDTFGGFDGGSGDFDGVGYSGSYAGGSGPVVAPPNFVPVPAARAADRSVIPPAAEDPTPVPATSPR